MRRLATFVLVGTVLFATMAIAQSATDANMEILIQKMKADKKLLVAGNMDLTDAEAKSFWPMYDAYQKELGQINHQLGRTIKQYAEAYNSGTVSNDLAKKLLGEALAIEEAEVNLKRSYAKKLGTGAAGDEGRALHPDRKQDPSRGEGGACCANSACVLGAKSGRSAVDGSGTAQSQ